MKFRFDNLIVSPERKFHNYSQKSSGIPGTFEVCLYGDWSVSPLFPPFVTQKVIPNYILQWNRGTVVDLPRFLFLSIHRASQNTPGQNLS